jgi:hypothetical protein
MHDRINPFEDFTGFHHQDYCEKCDALYYEESLVAVWISIHDYQSWCEVCARNHATEHPIIKNELWAIGSTDTENNLTIK